jgi:hypothetical protein
MYQSSVGMVRIGEMFLLVKANFAKRILSSHAMWLQQRMDSQ